MFFWGTEMKHGIARGEIGIESVMDLFGKSRRTVYRMISEGRLPNPLRNGKRIVWDKNDIDRHLKYGKHLIKR